MSRAGTRLIFRFGEFECDAAAYELRRKRRRLRLSRQPMDLLLLLLERPGELVSRDEIAKHLWGEEVFVDRDAGIRTAVLKIRQVLGDARESSRFVETVAGKGYRFIAAVAAVPAGTNRPDARNDGAPAERSRRHNLPAELTRFIGRKQPLAELRMLLSASRLVSLIGSGGVGKTRLAIRLAFDLGRAFPDGVWLIDLASLTSAGLIDQSVATVFNVRESPQRSLRDALVDYVRDRELLLILDTCEHVIDGCAEMVEVLLRAAPALRIVATSREALRVPGETVYRVPCMSVPAASESATPDTLAEFEATLLFVERATTVQPGFTVNPQAAVSIAAIARRLEGIPLAIELAATQVASLSPQQIEARLAAGWVTGSSRTGVTRQRTLDTTVAWSYELLDEAERTLFSRLSVFPRTWTLEAAESVCAGDGIDSAGVSDLLSRLVDKSLVTVGGDGLGDRRYYFLETIAHYARERLTASGTADAWRDRHFAFFHREFRDAGRVLTGPDQAACLRRLQSEQANIRAALDWGLSSPVLDASGVELAAALFWYWTKRGLFAEGRQWLERAEAIPSARRQRALVAFGLGHMDYFQARFASMTARNDEVLAWGREEGDAWLVSRALFGHGLAKFECGEFLEAGEFARAARDASPAEDFSAPSLILGNIALVMGDRDRALACFDEAIEGLRHAGELWGLGIVLSLAAGLRIIREEFAAARAHATEALSIYRELEDPRGIAWSLEVFAALIAARGHPEEAARVWGASDRLLDSVGGALPPTIGWIREHYLEPAKAAVSEPLFHAARAEGRAWSQERAMAFATRRFDLIVRTGGSSRLSR